MIRAPRRKLAVSLLCALATSVAVLVPHPGMSSAEASAEGGVFRPVSPFRLAYTSTGAGGYSTPIGAGETRAYTVLGKGGVPTAGVSAVVLDVASFASTTESSIRIWQSGVDMPNQSVLKTGPDMDRSNTAIVPVGADGKINMWNSAGSVKYNIDIQGYFTTPGDGARSGAFVPLTTPRRVVSSGTTGIPSKVLAAGVNYDVQITGGAIPSTATSLFVNVKVGGNSGIDGGIQLGRGGADISGLPPSVNFQGEGWTDSGLTVALSADGRIRVRNATSGATPYIYIDVQGYFDGDPQNGGGFVPLRQASLAQMTIPARAEVAVSPVGKVGIPTNGSFGTLATTVTATRWDSPGSIRLYTNDESPNAYSDLSFNNTMNSITGVSTTTLIGVGEATGEFAVRNESDGPVTVRLVSQGYFNLPVSPLDFEERPSLENEVPTDEPLDQQVVSTTPLNVEACVADVMAENEALLDPDSAEDRNAVEQLCPTEISTETTATVAEEIPAAAAGFVADDGTTLGYAARKRTIYRKTYKQEIRFYHFFKAVQEGIVYYDKRGHVWSDQKLYGYQGEHDCYPTREIGVTVETVKCSERRMDWYHAGGRPIKHTYRMSARLIYKGSPVRRAFEMWTLFYADGNTISRSNQL
ncbi:hypothetical protein GCM10027425_33690 [Alteromonas gracilis]